MLTSSGVTEGGISSYNRTLMWIPSGVSEGVSSHPPEACDAASYSRVEEAGSSSPTGILMQTLRGVTAQKMSSVIHRNLGAD
jgi:hypothetical protein